MFCTHCGAEVDRNRDQFCTHCGKAVSKPLALTPDHDVSAAKKKTRKGFLISLILLAAISLVSVYAVYFTDLFKDGGFFGPSPEEGKVSQDQLTSEEGDSSTGKQIIETVTASSNPRGYAYHIYEDGAISISSYKGDERQHLQIPQMIDGRVVERLSNKAFYYAKELESITFPNTLTSIGSNCFQGCTSLRQIDIPDSVTSIRKFAFYGCLSLEEMTLPASLHMIGEGAFGRCDALKTLHYGGSYAQWSELTNDVRLGFDASTVEMTFGE